MFGNGFGGGPFWVIASLFGVLFWVVAIAAAIFVAVLLVRFLLVGTRAAQAYLAAHEPKGPATPPRPDAGGPTLTGSGAPAAAQSSTVGSDAAPRPVRPATQPAATPATDDSDSSGSASAGVGTVPPPKPAPRASSSPTAATSATRTPVTKPAVSKPAATKPAPKPATSGPVTPAPPAAKPRTTKPKPPTDS